jgi:hypothetical protein|uniref:Uncharacterized protein n=1 Tax=Myoviridae sp. ctXXl13 TaxID=2827691 RepID=A0A8S5TJB1_9CAUD|nr:MAG TPA: hypothetical protein [Myoviridae sp. ctXXl13]
MAIFIEKDNFIFLDTNYCEFYIPEYYFDNKWATYQKDSINCLGVFEVGIGDSNGNIKERKTLNVPVITDFYYNDMDETDITGSDGTVEKCIVLKYTKGDKVMNSFVVKDSVNAALFLSMITKGKLPKTIKYTDLITVFNKNKALSGVNFGVPSSIEELVLAVSYRDKNDITRKFATVIGAGKAGEYDYTTTSIRKICQYASTFSAMTFEDVNSMIITSVNRTRHKKNEMDSPVEKILKY